MILHVSIPNDVAYQIDDAVRDPNSPRFDLALNFQQHISKIIVDALIEEFPMLSQEYLEASVSVGVIRWAD